MLADLVSRLAFAGSVLLANTNIRTPGAHIRTHTHTQPHKTHKTQNTEYGKFERNKKRNIIILVFIQI